MDAHTCQWRRALQAHKRTALTSEFIEPPNHQQRRVVSSVPIALLSIFMWEDFCRSPTTLIMRLPYMKKTETARRNRKQTGANNNNKTWRKRQNGRWSGGAWVRAAHRASRRRRSWRRRAAAGGGSGTDRRFSHVKTPTPASYGGTARAAPTADVHGDAWPCSFH